MTSGKLYQDKPIMMSELDSNFKREVAEEKGGENIQLCFTCGTCSAVCPVFSVNDTYNPRKIIRMVLLGMKEEVLSSEFIWLCSGCYSCYERCPRDVKITSLMGAIRNIAVREGHLPKAMGAAVDLLKKFGRILEVSEFENTVRAKKGIPELEFEISEIKKVLNKAGIHEATKEDGNDE
ncbi:MAG: 4Fe-4S dicluster domain-containing protein [Nitrospinaceae bacterium]|jgi:heterodisulfide reductase subunit C|nr:4Fe-4S dicluster domain-containing protein [Nitrospinaceae bacterium]